MQCIKNCHKYIRALNQFQREEFYGIILFYLKNKILLFILYINPRQVLERCTFSCQLTSLASADLAIPLYTVFTFNMEVGCKDQTSNSGTMVLKTKIHQSPKACFKIIIIKFNMIKCNLSLFLQQIYFKESVATGGLQHLHWDAQNTAFLSVILICRVPLAQTVLACFMTILP